MAQSALLTGSTGYLGINLLHSLLRQENIHQVLCTTRHKDHEAFWKSIESQANKFNVPLNLAEAKLKVEVVSVDLVNDHASILPTLEKYNQTVNTVHHLACDATYGHPIEHFKPWINCTKALIRFCMDPKYPKRMYAIGSYGRRLLDHPSSNPIEDSYWINGYFQYKRWLFNYMQAKMDEGLSGTLFEPAYLIGTVDPGQEYLIWRIARLFVALGYGFEYPMGFTPTEMMIDNYMLTVNYPDKVQRVMSPCIPYRVYLHRALQKLVPNLKIVDYEEFRNIIKKIMPQKLKYFGPNVPTVIEAIEPVMTFHPLYDVTKFEKEDLHDYLLTCSSLTEAVELGLKDRDKLRHMEKNVAS